MAEQTTKKPRKPKNPLVGNQAKPVVLDSTTKLDIDTEHRLADTIIEAGLSSKLDITSLEHFTSISNARDQVYTLIDTMCQDSAVSSIVRTYTDDVCEAADNGHIVWCEANDPKISKFVNYLLNVMNVDKQIDKWAYCLIKYGDVYLRLYRESDYVDKLFSYEHINKVNRTLNEDVNLVMHKANEPYSYYVEMVPDPSTMFELTKYGQTFGFIEVPNTPNPIDQSSYVGGTTGLMSNNSFNFRYKASDVNVYQADDFVHAALEDNVSRFPETVDLFYEDTNDLSTNKKLGIPSNNSSQTYTVKRGKSLLYDSYKIWREKALLEAAVLLSRLTRSGIVRKVAVEVGDMPKEQVQQTLRRVKELFEQRTAYNPNSSMSEYTSPSAVDNFIYYATHNGQGSITIDSVGGDYDPKQLTDLDWWNNKFYSSYGIPKQYFGWTEDGAGFNGGTSLSIISSVYAKGVKRIQNTLLQAITDIINLFLLNKGCKAYLNNFVLKMRAPLTQEELDFRSNFSDRITAVNNSISLFNDVEDKADHLTIVKNLIRPLNLGDEINVILDKEIKAAQEAAKKAAEEEAAEAEAAKTAEAEPTVTETETAASEEEEDEDLDLGMSTIATETFNAEAGSMQLNEEHLVEDDTDLPTPEEADDKKDFTENY